jgi:glycerol-3-phosphate dehydrogenase (NAD(P)+)
MSYIAVIGAGSWGTTLAYHLSSKGYDISLWVNEEDLAQEMEKTRINSVYLPDVSLPQNIRVTHHAGEAVEKARFVLNVVPTQYVRHIFRNIAPHISAGTTIINASKGIERGTLMTVSAIIREVTDLPYSVLSGPSFAKEVIKKMPTAVTLAISDKSTGLLIQEVFNTNNFRVYTHDDIIGVEIGGALKNVIAIASGICDGLGLGHSARAALITRGLIEIKRLGMAMGAKQDTLSGLSGLGDLVLTCTGPLSRNYTVGTRLGQGLKLNDILSQTKMVAEGVATAESAFQLAQKHGIEVPIIEQVYQVIYLEKDPAAAVTELMTRPLKPEFYG